MKKVYFDKLVSLTVDETEEETNVVVNGAKFVLEDGVLKEEVDKLTVKQAKEIEAKYTPVVDEEGNKKYSPEDIVAIQEEVKQYQVKEEIALYIGEENVLVKIKELQDR